jgi:hypothetical protein
MTDTTTTAGKTPWWFWLVCAIAILWNGFGAYDFAMSALQGDAYYRSMKMTEAMIAYMHTYPAWMWAMWFAGTVGGFIGSVLLLLRSRWALHAFVISLAGFLMSLVYAYGISKAPEGTGNMAGMHAVIFVGCVFFIWFAWWTTKKGLLR